MRVVNGVLCLVLVVFAGVQYNDPDAWFWVPVYLVPAAWTALAALRPERMRRGAMPAALGACLLAALAGTVYFWPREPGFWRQSVWWESETAREGMGIMIVAAALVVAALGAAFARRRND